MRGAPGRVIREAPQVMQKSDTEITLDLDKVEDAGARSHGLDFPRTLLSDGIEAVLEFVGSIINWVWIVLVLIIVGNVVGRYALGVNYVWVEEVQWHIYAVGFMLGIGYAMKHDAHVRVDVVAMNLRPRARAWIELIGILVLLAPVIYVILLYAVPFVEASWRRGESSSAPGGLNHRWAIKAVIVVAFVYLGLAALARLARVCAFLFGFPRPRQTG
jgi:TRAP-type mannitol/chloroaromatic compound transport system permease small subunit